MYYILETVDDKGRHAVAVPEQWLKEGKKYSWPIAGNSSWVKDKRPPKESWPVFSYIKILKTTSSYEKTLQFLLKMAEKSNISCSCLSDPPSDGEDDMAENQNQWPPRKWTPSKETAGPSLEMHCETANNSIKKEDNPPASPTWYSLPSRSSVTNLDMHQRDRSRSPVHRSYLPTPPLAPQSVLPFDFEELKPAKFSQLSPETSSEAETLEAIQAPAQHLATTSSDSSASVLTLQQLVPFFKKVFKKQEECLSEIRNLQMKMDRIEGSLGKDTVGTNEGAALPEGFAFPLEEVDQLEELNICLTESSTKKRMMKNFLLIEFWELVEDEEVTTVSVVPKEWVEVPSDSQTGSHSVSVWWPSLKSIPTNWIIKGKPPNKTTWVQVNGKVLAESNKYQKLKKAEVAAQEQMDLDISPSESDCPKDCGRGKRKSNAVSRLISESESESSSEEDSSSFRPRKRQKPSPAPTSSMSPAFCQSPAAVSTKPFSSPAAVSLPRTQSSAGVSGSSTSRPPVSASCRGRRPTASLPAAPNAPKRDFFRVLFTVLEDIQQQQDAIYQLLAGQQFLSGDLTEASLPNGLQYPVASLEDLNGLEELLEDEDIRRKMITCLASVGGKGKEDMARNILRKLIKGQVAVNFNMTGQGRQGKLSFKKLRLKEVVYAAVKVQHKDAADTELDKIVGRALQDARDWDGRRRTERRNPEFEREQHDEKEYLQTINMKDISF